MTLEWAMGAISVLILLLLGWVKSDTLSAVKLCRNTNREVGDVKCDIAEVRGIVNSHGKAIERHDRILNNVNKTNWEK